MRHIVGFAGSLRQESFNRRLIAAAAALAKSVSVDVYDDLARVPLFDADEEATLISGPSAVKELRERVRRADGLLIATPEYNQSLPAVTKNAVDWLSRKGDDSAPLGGKPVAIMGATDGPWGTRYAQKELRHTLTAAGALVMPSPMVFVPTADDAFDGTGKLIDTAVSGRIERLLDSLDGWIATVSG